MAGEKLGLPVGLNNRALCCKITGFLPIHVVVANRNTAMFDYLSLTLPTKWRAELTQTTKVRVRVRVRVGVKVRVTVRVRVSCRPSGAQS